jgi:Zn-finger protein
MLIIFFSKMPKKMEGKFINCSNCACPLYKALSSKILTWEKQLKELKEQVNALS